MTVYESVSHQNEISALASVLEQGNIFLWLAASGCLRNYGKLERFLSISKYTDKGKSLIKFRQATKST